MPNTINLNRWLKLIRNKREDLPALYRALLIDELYDILFRPDGRGGAELSKSVISKVAGGYPEQNERYARAAAFLGGAAEMDRAAARIRDFWQARAIADFTKNVRDTLDADGDFQAIVNGSRMEPVRQWLRDALDQGRDAAQPDVLTVLTLLSVTRSAWEAIAEALPLTQWDAPETRDSVPPELRDKKRGGLAFLRKNRYFDAIDYLQDALAEDGAGGDSAVWNGEILYLISRAYRGVWRAALEMHQANRDEDAFEYLQRCALYGDKDLLGPIEKALNKCLIYVRKLLTQAAEAGCPEARLELAKIYLKPNRPAWDREQGATLCQALIHGDAPAPIRGEACWLLYKRCADETDGFIPPEGESAEYYLESAYRCGFPQEAIKLYNALYGKNITLPLAQSEAVGAGICLFNAQNAHAARLAATVPAGWKTAGCGEADISAALESEVPVRFMLIGDDAGRNIRDLLRILEQIRTGEGAPDAEAYIRGREEQLAPIVDTALNHMEDRYIPVHILDDDKHAAQRLLSRHPLLYPVREAGPSRRTLRFAIIGDTSACQWLAREAFWMTAFRDERIEAKITLIGRRAPEMRNALAQQCPEMFGGRARSAGLPLPEIEAVSSASSNFSLSAWVSDAMRAGDALYFAVDSGDDMENLQAAIQLREETVRDFNWLGGGRVELPVIAFRCEDPDIANLGARTIVVNEDHGMGWFNNYNLIPYGTMTRYTWDMLTNDPVDKLSYCFHMVYNGIPWQQPANTEKAARAKAVRRNAERDYYTRAYNRDSCRAAALSLPYRLLQARYRAAGSLVPESWSILDEDAFFSETALRAFADRLDGAPRAEEALSSYGESQQLAEWEHVRWARFMLSRGWVGASPEQAEAYYRAGNPRQQLYIGRMHPCITPYSKLEPLEKHLRATVGLDKNFRKSDMDSILATEDILRLRWIEPLED